jgi:AcrR family transcriptional regulator
MARTRSASAHRKVLDAALALVAERGVEGASMDAIAELSGVSKATVYKHWSDKEALLLEMLADLHGLHIFPRFDSGDTRADMAAVLAYRPPERTETRERITPHLIAYSTRNAAFGIAWRKLVMQPPLQALKRLIEQGMHRGELRASLDIELSLSLLLGPMIYWKVFLEKSVENPKKMALGVTDAFWEAFGTQTDKERR